MIEENAIKNEISLRIKEFLIKENVIYDSSANYTDFVISYFDYFSKRIPIKKYVVHFSQELKDKKANLDNGEQLIIDEFCRKFNNGEDMNNHLSKNILYSQRYDMLLNQWNIKHLHLSLSEDMNSNRSSRYLLILVHKNDVYFLDVMNHLQGDEFANLDFLWILYKNDWLEKAGAIYSPEIKSIGLEIRNKEDLNRLWKSGVNQIIYNFEGKYYTFVNGITLSKNSISSSFYLTELNKVVYKIASIKGAFLHSVILSEDKPLIEIKVINGNKLMVFKV